MSEPEPLEVSRELDRDDLLRFIELDLWSRFQSRMWGVVSTVLVLVSIGGLFGVPYYINNEISARLEKNTQEFERRNREILQTIKLLGIVSNRYNQELAVTRQKVFVLLDGIAAYNASQPKEEEKISDWIVQEIEPLAWRPDLANLENQFIDPFMNLPDPMGNIKVVPGERIVLELAVPTGAVRSQHGHPIQNGSLEGALRDIQFRIIAIQAYQKTMNLLNQHLLELGGSTILGRREEVVGVASLLDSKFTPDYKKQIDVLATNSLDKDEQKKFSEVRHLYEISLEVH